MKAAPFSFALAIIVFLTIIVPIVWLIINWSYSSVVSSKDAQIALLERQRDDFREQWARSVAGKPISDIDREKRKTIRISLAQFLTEGQQLMQRCAAGELPVPETEANLWADRTEKFMREKLDESYVARFRDSSDTPSTMITGEKLTKEHQNLWDGIRNRAVRLQQFVREFSDN